MHAPDCRRLDARTSAPVRAGISSEIAQQNVAIQIRQPRQSVGRSTRASTIDRRLRSLMREAGLVCNTAVGIERRKKRIERLRGRRRD
jgi:hypothetical protein